MESEKEDCVLCGDPTPYNKQTPVDRRKYYVRGAGQLCGTCHKDVYGE